MKIVIHGTKGGYKVLYATPESPSSIAGDSRPLNSYESAVGQMAYSISFTAGGSVFTKYLIVRDLLRNMATGNIAFSVFFPSNEKLQGAEVKTILDRISSIFKERYLPENNLGNIPEDYQFVEYILAEYKSKILANSESEESLKPKESYANAAYIYYSNDDELIKYFDAPFQDEYFDGKYRQVFFVEQDLAISRKSPLHALKYDEEANLTYRIDLSNIKYKLLFSETIKGGISVEVKVNGNRRKYNDKVRKKDLIEILYSKPYFQQIKKGPARWNEISDEFIVIDDVKKSITINDVELKPIEKEIVFELKDSKGIELQDVELKYKKNYSGEKHEIATSNKITFRGEELKEKWTVEAQKNNLVAKPVTFVPVYQDEPINLILEEYRKVKIAVSDKSNQNPISDFQIKVISKEAIKDKEIEFIGKEIDQKWKIIIECKGYETLTFELCPREEQSVNFQELVKKPIEKEPRYFVDFGNDGSKSKKSRKNFSNKSDGSDIPNDIIQPPDGYIFKKWQLDENDKEGGYDGTLIAIYEKKPSWFQKNRKLFFLSISSILSIWVILLLTVFFINKQKTAKTESDHIESRIISYLDGTELNIDTLYHFKNIYCSKPSNFTTQGNLFDRIFGITNRKESKNYIPEFCARIDDAIAIREAINNGSISELNEFTYSEAQQSFKNAIETTNDDSVLVRLRSEVSSIKSLSLDSIANLINKHSVATQNRVNETPIANERIESIADENPNPAETISDLKKKENESKPEKPNNETQKLLDEAFNYVKGNEIQLERLRNYEQDLNKAYQTNTKEYEALTDCIKFRELIKKSNNKGDFDVFYYDVRTKGYYMNNNIQWFDFLKSILYSGNASNNFIKFMKTPDIKSDNLTLEEIINEYNKRQRK